jgi:hypothetical protein
MVKYNPKKVKKLIILWLEDSVNHLRTIKTQTLDDHRELEHAKEEIQDCICLLEGKEIIRTSFELFLRPRLRLEKNKN